MRDFQNPAASAGGAGPFRSLELPRHFCLAAFAALTAGAATASLATCPSMPEIEATVLISSCAAATFAPSNSSSGTSSGEPARLYLERESYSGTVLGAVVESAHLTGDRSRGYRSAMAGTWRKGASETLFVPRPVDAVCPDKLPVELTVQTARACCDELPLRGQCLVPDTIIPVTIIPRSRP